MFHHRFFAPWLLVAIAAGCAGNRQTAPAALPVPLVTALLTDRGAATRAVPQYTNGTLPPGYPAALVPTGPVRILGGMQAGDEIVAVFSDSTRRLAAVLEQLFQAAGFSRPAPTPGAGFSAASGPYSYFCGDSGTVSAEPLTGSNRNAARVTYRRLVGRNSCSMFRPPPPSGQLQLPELLPPAGVWVRGSHGGGSEGEINSSADMTGSALVPSTILAHYAAQLVAAGWTAAEPAVSARLAGQVFEAKNATGAPWEGVLMATGSATAMTISLSMHPTRKP